MTNLTRLLESLQGVRQDGNGWRALCPAHEDRAPSLKVDLGQDGAILLHCHAGCQTGAILDQLGLTQADLFDDSLPSGGQRRPRVKVTEDLTEEDRELRDNVYCELLDRLPLEEADLQGLRNRGLTLSMISRIGYASLVQPPRETILKDLYTKHGDRLFTVPGFLKGYHKASLSVRTGLLIPVRDPGGRIQALEVRTGDEGAKYRWLSSAGASSGTPVHVPLGCPVLLDTVRITEGPLKADVASALSQDAPTIGLASVSSWREAFPVLEKLRPRKVHLAFDSDWKQKPQVEEQLSLFAAALQAEGYEVFYDLWDGPKGIDDLLLQGKVPQTVSAGFSLPEKQPEPAVAELPEAPSLPLDPDRLTGETFLPELTFRDEEQPVSSLPALPPPEAEEGPAPSQDPPLVAGRTSAPAAPLHLQDRPAPETDLVFPPGEGPEEAPSAPYEPGHPPSRPQPPLTLPDLEVLEDLPPIPSHDVEETPEAQETAAGPGQPMGRRTRGPQALEDTSEPEDTTSLADVLADLAAALSALTGSEGPDRPDYEVLGPVSYPPLQSGYSPQEGYAVASSSVNVSNRAGLRGAGGHGFGSLYGGDRRANFLEPNR